MQHGFHVARFVDMTLDLGIAPLKAEELKKDEVRGLPKLSWRCSAKLLLSYNALNFLGSSEVETFMKVKL